MDRTPITDKENLVTFEVKDNLTPIEPVHVSVHLDVYTRPDFEPKPGEHQAFQEMVDRIGDAIQQFKRDIGAIEGEEDDRP